MSHADDQHELKVRQGAAVWREIDGETVLLALDSSQYLGLNQTATVLWPAMTGGTSRGELITLLTEQFGIDSERAEADVDSFVDMCRAHRLLQ